MARTFLALCVYLLAGAGCDESRKAEEIIAALQSQVHPGMERSQVEEVLKGLDVTYAYANRENDFFGDKEFESHPVFGRLYVLTPHEPRFGYMKQADIEIAFDADDRVLGMEIIPIGFTLDKPGAS